MNGALHSLIVFDTISSFDLFPDVLDVDNKEERFRSISVLLTEDETTETLFSATESAGLGRIQNDEKLLDAVMQMGIQKAATNGKEYALLTTQFVTAKKNESQKDDI